MELYISYGVVFGKCDASGRIDYESVELNEKETKAAMAIALTGEYGEYDDILGLEELHETRDNLYSEIENMEIQNSLDMGNEYTMECQGTLQMDTDELNYLVHSRDEHAIEFFNLEDASDEEIEEWDAEDLDEIPTIADFTPGFEPESPYDNGWTLNLFVEEVSIKEEELVEYLKSLFADNDIDTINKIKQNCNIEFDRDIDDIILEVAKEMDCKKYIASCTEQ